MSRIRPSFQRVEWLSGRFSSTYTPPLISFWIYEKARLLKKSINGFTKFPPGFTFCLNKNRKRVISRTYFTKYFHYFQKCDFSDVAASSCHGGFTDSIFCAIFKVVLSGSILHTFSRIYHRAGFCCLKHFIKLSIYSNLAFCIAQPRWPQMSAFELLRETGSSGVLLLRCFFLFSWA